VETCLRSPATRVLSSSIRAATISATWLRSNARIRPTRDEELGLPFPESAGPTSLRPCTVAFGHLGPAYARCSHPDAARWPRRADCFSGRTASAAWTISRAALLSSARVMSSRFALRSRAMSTSALLAFRCSACRTLCEVGRKLRDGVGGGGRGGRCGGLRAPSHLLPFTPPSLLLPYSEGGDIPVCLLSLATSRLPRSCWPWHRAAHRTL